MFTMASGPIKNPLINRPESMEANPSSEYAGPIRKTLSPRIREQKIIVRRTSSHFGNKYGVSKVAMMYMNGWIPNIRPSSN